MDLDINRVLVLSVSLPLLLKVEIRCGLIGLVRFLALLFGKIRIKHVRLVSVKASSNTLKYWRRLRAVCVGRGIFLSRA